MGIIGTASDLCGLPQGCHQCWSEFVVVCLSWKVWKVGKGAVFDRSIINWIMKFDSDFVKSSGLESTLCRSNSHLAWEKLFLQSCVVSSLMVLAKIVVAFITSL